VGPPTSSHPDADRRRCDPERPRTGVTTSTDPPASGLQPSTGGTASGGPSSSAGLPALATRPLLLGSAVLTAVLIAASTRYGYHRDELYFLACGRRLAWGYPDQPPLTPALARLTELVRPHDLVVFKLPAVAIVVGTIWLTALIAREFGGGRTAQGLAAFAVGTGAFPLTAGHLMATSTADFGIWVLVTWLVIRILRTGRQRLWLVVGAAVGVGLLNKQLPALLAGVLLVGVLLTPTARPALRSRWLYAGAAIAAACWAPVLIWQADHGWPQVTLARQIHAEYGRLDQRVAFWVEQGGLFSIGATVLWVTGLVWLLRSPEWARYRAIGWAWIALMSVLQVTAGQAYYPAGLYPALIAAGAVVLARRRSRRGLRRLATGTALTALVVLPAALPVLPAATLDHSPWAVLGEPLRESVGWPQLVDQVRTAYLTVPADRRPDAVVLAGNYGEAGAVEEYGPGHGVPASVFSGHNGFADWGPPAQTAGPVVLIWEGGHPEDWFIGCTAGRRVLTGVHNEESESAAIYVCAGPIGGWKAAWPRLSHLSA
jgi:hypothetical protein